MEINEIKIRTIEKEIDNYFRKHDFVKLPGSIAIQYLLLVFEYAIRPIIPKNLEEVFPEIYLSRQALLQRNKNSLMESINWIREITVEENNCLLQEVDLNLFRLAKDFFDLGDAYHGAVSAYTMWNRGLAKARVKDDYTLHFEYRSEERMFDVLDAILADKIDEEQIDKLSGRDNSIIIEAKNIVENSVKQINDYSISYSIRDVNTEEMKRVVLKTIKGFTFIPRNWKFYSIHPEDLEKFWCALISVCILHQFAIYFAFSKFSFKHEMLLNSIIARPLSDWIRQLSRWTKLPRQLIGEILNYHIYSSSHQKPDIVLTPFIYVTDKHLALSPSLIITNNLSRNLLKHIAKNYRDEFDKYSYVFEENMLERLKEKNGRFDIKTKINISSDKRLPDIDACIIDKSRKEIMFCECRWTIPAADPAEVADKVAIEREKYEQSQKLRDFILKNSEKIHDIIKLGEEMSFKGIFFIIIFENHVGSAFTLMKDIPIIDLRIFIKLFRENNSLQEMFETIKAQKYLPREDIDFKVVEELNKIGNYKLGWTSYLI